MTNDFNLQKFLTENKMTRNSRLLAENEGEKELYDIIVDNKEELANKFNLDSKNLTVGGNEEGEPVFIEDNDNSIELVKEKDWEDNKGFFTRNQGIGKITLDGIDIIYVVNPR
jgi:hypothetical protein